MGGNGHLSQTTLPVINSKKMICAILYDKKIKRLVPEARFELAPLLSPLCGRDRCSTIVNYSGVYKRSRSYYFSPQLQSACCGSLGRSPFHVCRYLASAFSATILCKHVKHLFAPARRSPTPMYLLRCLGLDRALKLWWRVGDSNP